MDGQQAGIADTESIVTRQIAPVRLVSNHAVDALACVALGLLFFAWAAVMRVNYLFPTTWVFLVALGAGAVLYFVFGVRRVVSSWTWRSFRVGCRAEAEEALKGLAVHPLLRSDTDVGHTATSRDCWPTGVAWDGQFLYVLDHGTGARIPLSMVREWRWTANRAGTTGWAAAGNQVDVALAREQAAVQDVANRWRAEAGNGLFLSVRDVDRPTWQFQTSDEGVLRRWEELLRQAFEGQAPLPVPAGADPGGSAASLQAMSRPTQPASVAVRTTAGRRARNLKLLGGGLAAAAALVALLIWTVRPVDDPNAYLSGSLESVERHIRHQAWGSDAGALDPGQNLDRAKQGKGRVIEAFLNRSLLAYSLAMPVGSRKREFLRTFCREVLRQELMEAFAESGHRDDILRVAVVVSPEGKTFGNGKLLSPQVLEAVSRERARLPSLPSLRRCSEEIPFGVE